MDEQGLQNLLELGFSYEDLYKKGLLVLKSASVQNDENAAAAQAGSTATEEQNAQNQASADTTQSADADQSAGEAQSAADPTQSAEYIKMWKAFDLFKAEITKMIQGQNRENAFRDNPNDQAMTVSAAIEGLYKGGK